MNYPPREEDSSPALALSQWTIDLSGNSRYPIKPPAPLGYFQAQERLHINRDSSRTSEKMTLDTRHVLLLEFDLHPIKGQ